MKALIVAAVAAATLASSAGVALAQNVVPIRPNYRGEASCPSNYVIQGGACVSIYAGRRGGFREGYNEYRGDGRGAHRPALRPDGLLQCQSNYVIRNGVCVSLY